MAVVGIVAWGAYLPRRSALKRPEPDAVARSAAAWDEDSFTLALEAGRRSLEMHAGRDGREIDSVFLTRAGDGFEAGDRALVMALGLGEAVRIVALPPGADGPADALELALDQVETGRAGAALVLGASCGAAEGDGAAALVASGDPLVLLEGRARVNLSFLWAGGPDGVLAPARYDQREVVGPGLRSAVDRALGADTGVDHWSLSSPDGYDVARGLGFGPSPLGGDRPYSYAPGADYLLRLVELVAAAKEGDRMLAVNVGERAVASVWRAVAGGLEGSALAEGAETLDYAAHTLERRRRELEPGRVIDAMDYVREADRVLRHEGSRCTSCDRITVRSRTTSGTATELGRCDACGAGVEPVALARRATLRALTRSYLTPEERGAPTTHVVCDIDGGGRLMTELAGGESDDVEIGARVTLTLRRGYREHGRAIYFWKAVPHGD